ncbi:MAG: hypothetical protein AB1664_00750, partial [Thermodesulfobacteriota bacterium]
MPTLLEKYGDPLAEKPKTLLEMYGDPLAEPEAPRQQAQPQAQQQYAPMAVSLPGGGLDPRDFLEAPQAVAASTFVDPNLQTQQPSRFNPLGVLPKGSTETAMQVLESGGIPGIPGTQWMFARPELGPVGADPDQASIGERRGNEFGRLMQNIVGNVARFVPEQLLGGLEDPAAAGRGLIEFPIHVGANVGRAVFAEDPVRRFEAQEAIKERPLDVALLAVPIALRGLKALAKPGISERSKTRIIRQIEKARELGATEQQIRNAVGDDALVTHALRRLDAEVPRRVTGAPGSASRIKGNIEQSRRAREAA